MMVRLPLTDKSPTSSHVPDFFFFEDLRLPATGSTPVGTTKIPGT
jgi:hypothetical protein